MLNKRSSQEVNLQQAYHQQQQTQYYQQPQLSTNQQSQQYNQQTTTTSATDPQQQLPTQTTESDQIFNQTLQGYRTAQLQPSLLTRSEQYTLTYPVSSLSNKEMHSGPTGRLPQVLNERAQEYQPLQAGGYDGRKEIFSSSNFPNMKETSESVNTVVVSKTGESMSNSNYEPVTYVKTEGKAV